MRFSLSILFIASLSYSLTAQATPNPVKPPKMFESGPYKATNIELKTDEIASLILLESILSVASSAVSVDSCQALEGKYPFKITADGSINKPEANFIIVNFPKKTESLVLNATIASPDAFRGQKVSVRQSSSSKLKKTVISQYSADATFNRNLTLLSMHSDISILGRSNVAGRYQSEFLKNFYEDKERDSKSQKIEGWGMASLSENNYPISKYWVIAKATKVNGRLKQIVLQQDRVTGVSFCRIAIDGSAYINMPAKEKQKSLMLKGMMTISKAFGKK